MARAIHQSSAGAVAGADVPANRLGRRSARTRLLDVVERNTFIVFVLTICGAVLTLFARNSIESDGWFSLEAGRAISRSGIPHHDTWNTLTLGRTWVDQQWLAHLGIYALWSVGGWPLTLLSVIACFMAAFAIATAAARLLGASERAVAIIAIPCFLAGSANTALRAQIPAYVLFAVVLLLLLTDEQRASRRTFLVFPLLVLWANLHGSVILGAGLVALRGATLAFDNLRKRAPVREWIQRATALLVVPWICTVASPYGLALPGYYHLVLANSSFARLVTEWSPPTMRAAPFFFLVLLAGLWLISRQRNTLGPFARLAFLCSGVAALDATRNIVWFAFIAAATIPCAFDALWPATEAPRHRRANVALMGIAAIAAVLACGAMAAHNRSWFEHSYPEQAAAAVGAVANANPKLDVFATERYADWLLFEDPQLTGRVAYDTRFELLTEEQLSSIFDFRVEHGLDWQRVTHGYGLLVLDPDEDKGAVELFERRPGTAIIYRGRSVVVLRVVTEGSAH